MNSLYHKNWWFFEFRLLLKVHVVVCKFFFKSHPMHDHILSSNVVFSLLYVLLYRLWFFDFKENDQYFPVILVMIFYLKKLIIGLWELSNDNWLFSKFVRIGVARTNSFFYKKKLTPCCIVFIFKKIDVKIGTFYKLFCENQIILVGTRDVRTQSDRGTHDLWTPVTTPLQPPRTLCLVAIIWNFLKITLVGPTLRHLYPHK
jgi:hypothetical protein